MSKLLEQIKTLNNGWTPDWKSTTQKKYHLVWESFKNQSNFNVFPVSITKTLPDEFYFSSDEIGRTIISEWEETELYNELFGIK